MRKKTFMRHLIFAVVLAMLLAFTTVSAGAVPVTGVSGVEVTVDSNGSISESGGTVTVKVSGNTITKKQTNITIENTSGSAATISFDYTISNYDSSVSYLDYQGSNQKALPSSGTYSVLLAAGGTTVVRVSSARSGLGTCTATATLNNFKVAVVKQSKVTLSFDSALGSVTKDGAAANAGDHTVETSTFVATAKSGSTFLGWRDPDTCQIITTDASYQCAPSADMKLHAVFAGSGTAWFKVGNYLYDNLHAAANSGKGTTVVLMNNGTLTGSHTIPQGVTLLVPCDDANTVYTDKPGNDGNDSYVAQSVYRKLTMAANASITVNGSVSIGGKVGTHMVTSNSTAPIYTNGAPSGPLGYIDMADTSSITVQSGGNLYAWGFITGSGSVTVQSGGTVYEDLQIRDYRGGDGTTSMVGNDSKVFPFSQYYIQNVEVPLRLEAGATEMVCMTVSVTVLGPQQSTAAYIGNDTTGGLLRLTSGSITKTYDGSTDRIVYDIDGDVKFSNLSLTIDVDLLKDPITINSQDYVMNITHNMTLNVNEGSTVAVNQDLALLPGVIVNIAEGATVTVGSGNRLFVYDQDAWSASYVGIRNILFSSVAYAPGMKYTRTSADLVDAEILLNGTLDATNGYVYTTASGANIHSSGNGKFIVGALDGTTATYQVTQSGTDITGYPEIAVKNAWLLNGDGTFDEEGNYNNDATSVATGSSTTYPNTYTYNGTKWICETHTNGEAVKENNVAATCTKDGSYDTVVYCTVCSSEVSRETTTVAASGHTEVVDAAVAATCTATGLTEGKHCSVCGTVTIAQTEVAKLAHTEVEIPAVAATCTKTGLTAGKKCSVCGTVTVAQTEVAMLGHEDTDNDHICNNGCGAKISDCSGGSATCAAQAVCTICGQKYGDLAAHTYGEVSYTWSDDYSSCTASRSCTVCPEGTDGHTQTVSSKSSVTSTVDATHSAAGSTTHTATFDGVDWAEAQEKTEEIPQASHSYNAVVTDPTCTEQGYTTHTCACGVSYVDSYVAALGHDEVAHEAKAATCTEKGWDAYVSCSRCDYTTYKEIATLGHDEVAHEAKAPTCTAIGWDAYVTCSRCDYTTYVEKAALGHSYTSEVTTAATCTTAGVRTYTCSACGDTYTETVAALGHDEVAHEAKAPTCTEIGWDAYVTCSRCDYTTYKENAALGHDMVTDAAVAPTCTATGLAEGKHCSVCNEVLVAQETVPATGHQNTTTINVKTATCTEKGYTGDTYCNDCKTTTAYGSETAMADHNYQTVKGYAATCTQEGLTDGSQCTVCKGWETEQETIPATGHQNTTTTTVEATCTQAGSVTVTCDDCGATVSSTTTAANGHDWADATCTAPKTCSVCGATEGTANGHSWVAADCDTAKTCSVCGAIEGEALGHTEVIDAAKAPTCTATGLTEGKHCETCGEVLVAQTVVDALGHTEVVDAAVAATCTTAGKTEGKHCSVCNEVLVGQEVVDALGHTEGAAVKENEVAATCSAEGSCDNVVYCTVCKAELSRNTVTVDKIAHTPAAAVEENRVESTCTVAGSYDSVVYCSVCKTHEISRTKIDLELAEHTPGTAVEENRVESTCTVAGSYDSVVYCSVCKTHEISRTKIDLELAEHTPGTAVEENRKESTCTVAGSYDSVVYCSVCKTHEISRETITVSAVGHSYDDGVVTKEPTTTEAGVKTYTCTACGDSYTEEIPMVMDPVVNMTGKITPAIVTAPDGGWQIGENTFAVSCDVACIVAYTSIVDGETTYIRLTAIEVEGEANMYSFTVTLSKETQIMVAIAGDLTGDGVADSSDVMLINRSRLSTEHKAYRELSVWESFIGDLTGDGVADSSDAMMINRSRLSTEHKAYAKISWN